MNRRQFLKGAAALAAVAVVKTNPLLNEALSKTDQQKLTDKLNNGGTIKDQTFRLHGPIVIDGIENLHIYNCEFIFDNIYDEPMITFGKNIKSIDITNNTFRKA